MQVNYSRFKSDVTEISNLKSQISQFSYLISHISHLISNSMHITPCIHMESSAGGMSR